MGKEINVDEIEQVLTRLSSSDNIDSNDDDTRDRLPLLSLNHVSFVCKSVKKSVQFYEQVLGFVLIKRPSSFDFEGAWLFNHGIGIHLLEGENEKSIKNKRKINPKDNHISFQCSDMEEIVRQLEGMKIEYVKAVVREGGIIVDQIFFHDPDGYMIEICNCQNLPLLPISSNSNSNSNCPIKINTKLPPPPPPPAPNNNNLIINSAHSSFYGKMQYYCSGEVEALMMENLAMDMLNISI